MHGTSWKMLVEKKYINVSLYLMPLTTSNCLRKTKLEKKCVSVKIAHLSPFGLAFRPAF